MRRKENAGTRIVVVLMKLFPAVIAEICLVVCTVVRWLIHIAYDAVIYRFVDAHRLNLYFACYLMDQLDSFEVVDCVAVRVNLALTLIVFDENGIIAFWTIRWQWFSLSFAIRAADNNFKQEKCQGLIYRKLIWTFNYRTNMEYLRIFIAKVESLELLNCVSCLIISFQPTFSRCPFVLFIKDDAWLVVLEDFHVCKESIH